MQARKANGNKPITTDKNEKLGKREITLGEVFSSKGRGFLTDAELERVYSVVWPVYDALASPTKRRLRCEMTLDSKPGSPTTLSITRHSPDFNAPDDYILFYGRHWTKNQDERVRTIYHEMIHLYAKIEGHGPPPIKNPYAYERFLKEYYMKK